MNKYKAQKTEVSGITFDSKAEAKRYGELVLLQMAGYIQHLELQPTYELAPAVKLGGRKKSALRYSADFEYFDVHKGLTVIEDVKGMLTREFRIKQHLMKHLFDIEVQVVK